MSTNVEQLTIYDELDKEKVVNKRKMQKEHLLKLIQENEGILISLSGYLVGVKIDGSYLYLPDESFIPSHFEVVTSRFRTRRNAKKHLTLPDAIKEVTKRLQTKEIETKYIITIHYPYGSSDGLRGRTISESILHIHKDTNHNIVIEYDEIDQFSIHSCSLNKDDMQVINEYNQILDEWTYKIKDNPEIKALKSTLYSYDVQDILFSGSYNNMEKKVSLHNVISYYRNLDLAFNLERIPLLQTLAFRKLRSSLASYNYNPTIINLRQLLSFYHEFGHHIDYTCRIIPCQEGTFSQYYKKDIDYEKVNSIYLTLIDKCKNSESIIKFLDNKEKQIMTCKQDAKSVKHSSKMYGYYYNMSRKLENMRDYYIKPIELFARYFSDYMLYFIDKDNSKQSSFKESEIVEFKPIFEDLMRELKLFK